MIENIKKILNKDGRLIFNFDIFNEQEPDYGSVLSNYSIKDEKKVISIVETSMIDSNKRLINLTTFLIDGNKSELFVSSETEFSFNYNKVSEILNESGFTIEFLYSDYNKSKFDVNKNDECIMVAKN